MIHARDVINFEIIEGVQKTFAGDHFEPDQKRFIPIIFLASLGQKAGVQCISFHRSLSEGQEIDIGSKIFAGDHLESFCWNSSFLGSYHSTWSQIDVQSSFYVDRLISHVIRSKTFFHLLLS